MAKGHKTGGRKQGTANRRTLEVAERLEALGCDPIEGMARIAMNKRARPELRGRMFAELAQYVLPKRKAVEYTGSPMPEWVIDPAALAALTTAELEMMQDLLTRITVPAHGAAD